MSANYLYKQIIKGALIYEEVFKKESWLKYKDEVDELLRQNGYI